MMDAADFYTGIVVEAYAKMKSSHFDPEPYARFVETVGQPALEIGCGDGHPLLVLRRRGLDVDGLDSSGDMLDRCRSNATALGLEVALHHQRMEQMSLPRMYRSIYLAGPTLNLLPDDKTALQALQAIRGHLTSDGAALIPLWIPEPTPSADLGTTREASGEDGTVLRYTAVSEIYDQASRNLITTTRYERITPACTETLERDWLLHWYTAEQFQSMCAEAGLDVTAMVDNEGQPVTTRTAEFTATVKPK